MSLLFNKPTSGKYQKILKLQWSSHVGYTSFLSNTKVKQHWGWIILGWETYQRIPHSACNAGVVWVQHVLTLFLPSGATFTKKSLKSLVLKRLIVSRYGQTWGNAHGGSGGRLHQFELNGADIEESMLKNFCGCICFTVLVTLIPGNI